MLERIKEKADKAQLQTKLTTRKIEYDDETEERTELFIQIPNERDFKNLILTDIGSEYLELIEKSNFEKFKFIKGLEAIYSSELGIIECEIQTDDLIRSSGMLQRRLFRFFKPRRSEENEEIDSDEQESENLTIEFPSPSESLKIQLMESSTEFLFLCGCKRENYYFRRMLRPFFVIRLDGLTFKTHNEAKELLTNIANSVFFQIDLLTNIPMHLSSDKDLQREIRLRRKAIKEDLKFAEPKYQYDNESMSLYWYARNANNIPLLQYLAFYQVLEFYFPQYSAKETRERIKNLLKDPTFDRHSEKNISKILEIVKVSAKGKLLGDERSQIKATVLGCVDNSDLNDFFNESEERKNFFDESKKGKSLVSQKLSFNRHEYDARIDVANRIYELRCRIVHTKEEADSELLLPYSPDLALIKYDIDLIEFVARKVLIAGCKPLDIK